MTSRGVQTQLTEERRVIADLRAVTWRLDDPRASSEEKALMKLCGLAAESFSALADAYLALLEVAQESRDE